MSQDRISENQSLYRKSEISAIFMCDFQYDIEKISIDSRDVKKNHLFIALNGQNFNGNKFIKDVLKAGAYAVMDDEDEYQKLCKELLISHKSFGNDDHDVFKCVQADNCNSRRVQADNVVLHDGNCCNSFTKDVNGESWKRPEDDSGVCAQCPRISDEQFIANNTFTISYINLEPLNKIILVKNSLQALNAIALYARRRNQKFVIGITGNAGKTMTKELISFALRQEFSDVYETIGNLNNHIGCPLSVANLHKNAIGVFELGTDNPGEIKHLTDIVQPNIAIITNVGSAHIGHFKSQFHIAQEKCDIFNFIPQNNAQICVASEEKHTLDSGLTCKNNICELLHNSIGLSHECLGLQHQYLALPHKRLAIVNENSQYYEYWMKKIKEYQFDKILSINGDAQIVEINNSLDGCNITYKLSDKQYTFNTHIKNFSFYTNLLTVMLVLDFLKMDVNKILCKICKDFSLVNARGNIVQTKYGIVINDSYNASLEAMRNGIASLSLYIGTSNTQAIVVLGDIKGAGDESENIHQNIIPLLGKHRINKIFLCGEHMRKIFDDLCKQHFKNNEYEIFYEANSNDLACTLKKYLCEKLNKRLNQDIGHEHLHKNIGAECLHQDIDADKFEINSINIDSDKNLMTSTSLNIDDDEMRINFLNTDDKSTVISYNKLQYLIYVKGSHSMNMEKVVQELQS